MPLTSVGHSFCPALIFACVKAGGKNGERPSRSNLPGAYYSLLHAQVHCMWISWNISLSWAGLPRENDLHTRQVPCNTVNVLFVDIIKACQQFGLAKFHLPIWLGYVFFPEEGVKRCSFVSLLCSWQRRSCCARADKFSSEFFKAVILNCCPKKSKEK